MIVQICEDNNAIAFVDPVLYVQIFFTVFLQILFLFRSAYVWHLWYFFFTTKSVFFVILCPPMDLQSIWQPLCTCTNPWLPSLVPRNIWCLFDRFSLSFPCYCILFMFPEYPYYALPYICLIALSSQIELFPHIYDTLYLIIVQTYEEVRCASISGDKSCMRISVHSNHLPIIWDSCDLHCAPDSNCLS